MRLGKLLAVQDQIGERFESGPLESRP